jgi:predicted RNA-binding Zn-ribbon protein involved in translation (DUF1610 family)
VLFGSLVTTPRRSFYEYLLKILAELKKIINKEKNSWPCPQAGQRMSEVIGLEAKTIHRLLEYQGIGAQLGQPAAHRCPDCG